MSKTVQLSLKMYTFTTTRRKLQIDQFDIKVTIRLIDRTAMQYLAFQTDQKNVVEKCFSGSL